MFYRFTETRKRHSTRFIRFSRQAGSHMSNIKMKMYFKKGIGALTAPTFVKVSFYAQTVQVEAWLKYAILPGVFVGEIGMTGFIGCAVKGAMKNAVHQIEGMLQYYAYPPQQ